MNQQQLLLDDLREQTREVSRLKCIIRDTSYKAW